MAGVPINGPAPDLAEGADLAEQLGAEPAQDVLDQEGGFRNATTMDLFPNQRHLCRGPRGSW